jgi:hypothetical protein
MVTFVLRRGGQELLREAYPLSPDIRSIANDPTPMVEAEDFDLLLFVRNLLRDPERAGRIYRAV